MFSYTRGWVYPVKVPCQGALGGDGAGPAASWACGAAAQKKKMTL